MEFKEQVFWKDGFNGKKAKGCYPFRSFDLNKFMEKIESKEREIVGIKFEGNNCEIIFKNKVYKIRTL